MLRRFCLKSVRFKIIQVMSFYRDFMWGREVKAGMCCRKEVVCRKSIMGVHAKDRLFKERKHRKTLLVYI